MHDAEVCGASVNPAITLADVDGEGLLASLRVLDPSDPVDRTRFADDDERFATGDARIAHRCELLAQVSACTRSRTPLQVAETLHCVGVPAQTGPAPFRHIPTAPGRPAPLPGQDTREICHKILGMSSEETERLIDDGVLLAATDTG